MALVIAYIREDLANQIGVNGQPHGHVKGRDGAVKPVRNSARFERKRCGSDRASVHRRGSVKEAILRWVGAVGSIAMWGVAAACGGSSVDLTSPDGSIDGAGSDSSGGGGSAFEAMAPPDAAAEDSADVAAEANAPMTCAPPTDVTKAALCIIVSPEAIAFVAADPSFDGKGLLAVDVHDTANPDGPDGGSLPALQGMTFPSGDAGGAETDLSSPLPQVRFDGLPPGVVYPRVVFVDSRNTDKVGAGWWLGGYDLANCLKKPTLLSSVTLAPGVATTITIELTALRALGVTLTRSVTPIGNAEGPPSSSLPRTRRRTMRAPSSARRPARAPTSPRPMRARPRTASSSEQGPTTRLASSTTSRRTLRSHSHREPFRRWQ